jgi:hypothetical protein
MTLFISKYLKKVMAEIKISDLKSNKTIVGSKILKKFIGDCRDNLNSENLYEIVPVLGSKSKVSVKYKGEEIKVSANENSAQNFIKTHRKKYKISQYVNELSHNDIFCYEVGGKIAISRKVLEKISSKTFKSSFDTQSVLVNIIQKLVGYDEINESDYLDLVNPDVKIGTRLKQDFTCFVLSYFITNPRSTHYELFDKLRQKKVKINKTTVSISSTINDFDVFLYHTEESYSKFFDSIATAMTIIKNKNKLGVKNSLNVYTIVEEESTIGKKLKEHPFNKIRLNERNYYTDENKLSTADIYMCNTSSDEYKTLVKVFNKKTLNHEQYRSFINKSYKSGDIIPISLKELRFIDVGDDFTTNRIKVVNFISDLENDDVQDHFLKKVIELLSIEDKNKFISEMDKVVDIKNESINLNPYSTRTTLNFDLILKVNPENNKKVKQDHLIFIQGNQLYIKPPGTSSDAGLGGVSMEYLKEQILMKLPDRGRFIRQISSARVKAFGDYYQSTQDLTTTIYGSISNMSKDELIKMIINFNRKYPKQKIFNKLSEIKNLSKSQLVEKIENIREFKKYKNYSLLSKAAILSPSEFKTVFDNISNNLMVDISRVYIETLYSQLKKVPDIDTSLTGPFVSKTYGTKEKTILNKLSDIEIIYFLACNHNIVKKWIKNSFIMGAYGVSSAAGIIILDGKKHSLGKGFSGISRRNPVYVKIGM